MVGSLNELERQELERCETAIADSLPKFMELGAALQMIRDRSLYRETDETFDSYCRRRWGMTGSRAEQVIKASTIAKDLVASPRVTVAPVNADQVSPLASVRLTTAAEATFAGE